MDVDLIVVGLGPAGAALAYRAATHYGWRVLGIDPTTSWDKTLGVWVSDIPTWLAHLPVIRSTPAAHALSRHNLGQEYAVIDTAAWRAALVTFPTLCTDATIIDAHTVTAQGTTYRARWVVDARGPLPDPSLPVQQALGTFVDAPSTDATWMDLRPISEDYPPTFLYTVPTPHGMLHEETILITAAPLAWGELESRLYARGVTACGRIEHVLFSLGSAPYRGPAIPFGARAGFINPVTGYSVGTALRLVDATLDALSTHRSLPWHSIGFRCDQWLLRRAQTVLLSLTATEQCTFLELLFQLSPAQQQRFLQLGCWRGSVAAMIRMFRAASPALKRRCLRMIA